jgi:hypothetical protein
MIRGGILFQLKNSVPKRFVDVECAIMMDDCVVLRREKAVF